MQVVTSFDLVESLKDLFLHYWEILCDEIALALYKCQINYVNHKRITAFDKIRNGLD